MPGDSENKRCSEVKSADNIAFKAMMTPDNSLLSADLAEARGFSTNTVVICKVSDSLSKTSSSSDVLMTQSSPNAC